MSSSTQLNWKFRRETMERLLNRRQEILETAMKNNPIFLSIEDDIKKLEEKERQQQKKTVDPVFTPSKP